MAKASERNSNGVKYGDTTVYEDVEIRMDSMRGIEGDGVSWVVAAAGAVLMPM